jgi:hypothetical protein
VKSGETFEPPACIVIALLTGSFTNMNELLKPVALLTKRKQDFSSNNYYSAEGMNAISVATQVYAPIFNTFGINDFDKLFIAVQLAGNATIGVPGFEHAGASFNAIVAGAFKDVSKSGKTSMACQDPTASIKISFFPRGGRADKAAAHLPRASLPHRWWGRGR